MPGSSPWANRGKFSNRFGKSLYPVDRRNIELVQQFQLFSLDSTYFEFPPPTSFPCRYQARSNWCILKYSISYDVINQVINCVINYRRSLLLDSIFKSDFDGILSKSRDEASFLQANHVVDYIWITYQLINQLLQQPS